MPLLRVTALHKYYGDHHVLKGIDLTVEQGQVVAIIALTCLFSDVFPIVHPFSHGFNRKYAFYKCKIL